MIRVILFALLSTGYAGGCDDAEDLLNACPGAANVTCDDAMCVTAYIKNNCSSALFDAHTAACNIQKDAGVFGEVQLLSLFLRFSFFCFSGNPPLLAVLVIVKCRYVVCTGGGKGANTGLFPPLGIMYCWRAQILTGHVALLSRNVALLVGGMGTGEKRPVVYLQKVVLRS